MKRAGTYVSPSSKRLKADHRLRLEYRRQQLNPSQEFLLVTSPPGYQVKAGDKSSGLYLNKVDVSKSHILTPVTCQFSLVDFLKGKDTFESRPSAPLRPNLMALTIIKGLFEKVFDLHTKTKGYHGGLHHIENYGVEVVGNYADCRFPETGVILLHDNTSREDKYGEIRTVYRGQIEDIDSLRLIIKEHILNNVAEDRLASDVKDLLDILKNYKSASVMRDRVSRHSSLWDSKRRFYFYEQVWGLYKNGDQTVQKKIEKIMWSLSCVKKGWQSLIPQSGPISNIYRHGRNTYNSYDVMELLRFCRVAFAHIEQMGTSKFIHMADARYSRMDYFEMKMLETFPMMVEELNKGLSDENLL